MVRTIIALLLALLPLLAGCQSISYYAQAARGQLDLLSRREPIDQLITAHETSPALRAQLEQVLQIREFAADTLHLPVAGQYTSYADLERPYVVWNVFAAPALSLEAQRWCYPLAGCASYRGYFSETEARDFAATLAGQGLDTYVGGVPAYSTLGWFSDPVLNTFVYLERLALADMLFHELAHQRLYVPGDTVFNESFATAVAREGVRRFLADEPAFTAYHAKARQHEAFIKLVITARSALATAYAGGGNEGVLHEEKVRVIDRLREDYAELERQLGGELPYRAWVESPINNAKLNSVGFYYGLVPALESYLRDLDGDLDAFYRWCEELAALSLEERHARLNSFDGL